MIHFALLIAPGAEIFPEHLKITFASAPVESRTEAESQAPASAASEAGFASPDKDLGSLTEHFRLMFAHPMPRLFDKVEGLIVEEAFRHAGRNQVHAAALLGVTRNVMRTLLKRYGFIGGRPGEPDASEAGPAAEDAGNEENWRGAAMDATLMQG